MIYGDNSKKPPLATALPGSGSKAISGTKTTNGAINLPGMKLKIIRGRDSRGSRIMGVNKAETKFLDDIVLYMLHCGLDGKVLRKVCEQYGINLRLHQFPREELFAYHMHAKRQAPDMILIRGHFIGLVSDLDNDRHIPYVVVSSKLKYGDGQPVFIHAEKGYGSENTLTLYHSIARTIRNMIDARCSEGGKQVLPEE